MIRVIVFGVIFTAIGCHQTAYTKEYVCKIQSTNQNEVDETPDKFTLELGDHDGELPPKNNARRSLNPPLEANVEPKSIDPKIIEKLKKIHKSLFWRNKEELSQDLMSVIDDLNKIQGDQLINPKDSSVVIDVKETEYHIVINSPKQTKTVIGDEARKNKEGKSIESTESYIGESNKNGSSEVVPAGEDEKNISTTIATPITTITVEGSGDGTFSTKEGSGKDDGYEDYEDSYVNYFDKPEVENLTDLLVANKIKRSIGSVNREVNRDEDFQFDDGI